PAAERQGRLDGDAVERHREVGAGKSVAVNVAGDGGASSDRFIDLLPVDFLGVSGLGADEGGCAEQDDTHYTWHVSLRVLSGSSPGCHPTPRTVEHLCARDARAHESIPERSRMIPGPHDAEDQSGRSAEGPAASWFAFRVADAYR